MSQNEEASVETNTGEDKNWKAIREENKTLKEELIKYQSQERDELFKQVGLDRSKGIGKAADQMYEGDTTADALKAVSYTHLTLPTILSV